MKYMTGARILRQALSIGESTESNVIVTELLMGIQRKYFSNIFKCDPLCNVSSSGEIKERCDPSFRFEVVNERYEKKVM